MNVLTDSQIHYGPEALDRAWDGAETFAFVPHKSGVSGEWLETALAALPPNLHTEHFALLTSGSTGQPKLVIGVKRRTDALARVLHEMQDSAAIEQTIAVLPLTYCYAFVNQWRWARVMGRSLTIGVGFSEPIALAEQLERMTNGMLCLVGAQVPLLERTLAGHQFPGVRRLHFAGGRFPQDKLDVLSTFFPNAVVYNNYGCAEAMPRLTLRRADASPAGANIGRPLPGVELKTTDDNRLLFRSPFGCVGYVDGDGYHALTAGDWVPTGDLAHALPDGSWELLGRAGDVFKRYGEKVSTPSILTTVATSWGGHAETYRETDAAGEMGYVLVLAPQPGEDELRGILRALREHHPRAQWPLRVESLQEMPRLPNGKIDRMGLSTRGDRQLHWRQRI
ncbi:MAG TPA: AMP-binding protein [Ktedonobacterales bacterium]|nr:AMP-binding protein [Ktedonobacterales bacterium]